MRAIRHREQGLTLTNVILGVFIVAIILVGAFLAKEIFFKGGPDQSAGVAVAEVNFKQNVVKAKKANQMNWLDVNPKDGLFTQDSVRTYPDSMAVITFLDDPSNNLVLEENSLIVIDKIQEQGQKKKIQFTLLEGEVKGSVKPIGRTNQDVILEIKTPNNVVRADTSTAAGRQVALGLSVRSDQSAQLKVLTGKAEVAKDDKTPGFILDQNQFLQLKGGQSVGGPQALLAPPPPQGGNMQEVPFILGKEKALELRWGAVPNAAGYNVQIANNAEFAPPLLKNETVSNPLYQLDLKDPKEGDKIFWRVASVGKEGGAGLFTEPMELRLVPKASPIDKPPPPVVKPQTPIRTDTRRVTVSSSSIQLSGTVKPNHHLSINGRSVQTDQSGRFNVQQNLRQGLNTIIFEMIDDNGRITYVKREVVYKP